MRLLQHPEELTTPINDMVPIFVRLFLVPGVKKGAHLETLDAPRCPE